ncbi:MAG: peptidyl-prolyl cis-trans isomerase [Gemmataceae bacterium]|nr:peptidyl-prolyl cis-trans isomerase [Gemmataceae bacterium]
MVFTSAAPAVSTKAGPPAKPVNVAIDTSMGEIKLELWPDKAPVTVKNFLDYTDAKYYDGTLFHRVIPNFMVQGGGYVSGMKEKIGGKPPIKNESDNGLSNERGTIAMARETGADTATSEFYINVVDNKKLDRAQAGDKVGYCVFGKVTSGMDVVDKIKAVKTGTIGEHEDVPAEDVIIKSVRRVD